MTKPTSDDPEVTALRQEIAQTRAELGETVEALAARADVKARAQEKVDEAKERMRVKAQEVRKSAEELVREVRTQPAVPARRVAYGLRDSVLAHPREWAVAAATLVAFTLLVIRRRRQR